MTDILLPEKERKKLMYEYTGLPDELWFFLWERWGREYDKYHKTNKSSIKDESFSDFRHP